MGSLLTSPGADRSCLEEAELLKESQLSAKKLQCLRARFNKIDRDSKGYLTRADLLSLKARLIKNKEHPSHLETLDDVIAGAEISSQEILSYTLARKNGVSSC